MDESFTREILTTHGYHPVGKEIPVNPQTKAHVMNPFCGDELTVYLDAARDGGYRFVFQGQGCTVCMASASILSSTIRAETIEELGALYREADDVIHGKIAPTEVTSMEWQALAWLRENPRKFACVETAWKAAREALSSSV